MRPNVLTLVCVGFCLFPRSGVAAPKKPPKPAPGAAPTAKPAPAPKPDECAALAACVAQVEAAFEAGDFELAQRLVRRAEPLATTPVEQARVLILQGALDAQALGLSTPTVEDGVRAKFKEARRLDASASFLSIPAFARTDGLEKTWNEAAPPAPAIVTQAPPKTKPFPLWPMLLASGAVVAFGASGAVYGVASSTYERDRTVGLDAARFAAWENANRAEPFWHAAWIAGAALAVGAVVTFVLWLAAD
jgi:hypothetical protein